MYFFFTLLGHACNEILALNLIYPKDKKQIINIMFRSNTCDLWKIHVLDTSHRYLFEKLIEIPNQKYNLKDNKYFLKM